MKSASFFKGLSWLLILNLLVKPVWIFFIDRQVQNIAGNEEYGKYFSVLNLSFVLLFLADAGLSNMLNQRLAKKITIDVRQLLQVKFFLLIAYCIFCFFISWLTHITQWNLLFYVVTIQALTSLFVFLRSIVTAHQYFTSDAWFSVFDKLLMIFLCGGIIYTSLFGNMSLVLFLQVQVVCTTIAVIFAIFFITKKQLIDAAEKENIDTIIKRIMPFAIIILLMSAHYRLDGFLLERIHRRGAVEAGIYASAYRLLDAGNMAGYLAASFLVSFIARHQNDRAVLEETILNTRHALMFFAIGVVSFTILFAPWLQLQLYHSANPYHSLVMQLCIAAMPGYFLVHIYGSALTATARFNQFIYILLFSVLINLILNLLLIPAHGALGCCIAAIASQYFCGITSCVAATKNLKISFSIKSGFVYLFSATLLIALFYFGKMTVLNVWIILAIAVLINLLLLASQISFLKKIFIPR